MLDRDTERSVLTTLVQSEGWRELCRHIADNWSDSAVIQRLRVAVGAAPLGNESAQADAVARVLASREGIDSILNYPIVRLKQLDKEPVTADPRVVRQRA